MQNLLVAGFRSRGCAVGRVAGLTLLLWAAGGSAGAADRAPSAAASPAFYSVADNTEIVTLEKGLRVVLMRNSAQPMVGIYTQVKVGSAYEDFRTSGMSHMLEHLLFNGTEKYDQDQLYALADRAGAYNNAHTTDFFTNYIMVVPAGEIATGMEIQAQMLFASTLPEDKFAKEQGIVLGELVQGRDAPGHFADDVLREQLYAGSSRELPTVGTRATIANLQRDDVFAFYKRWYVPNNMTMAVIGNFDRDQALALLERYYGEVPPGTVPVGGLRPPAPIERTSSVVRRGGSQRLATLAFAAPGYAASDYFSFLVMTDLLAAPATGVLAQRADEDTEGWLANATVWWDRSVDWGRLVVQFDVGEEDDPQRCYPFLQEAVAAALADGVSDDEVRELVAVRETDTLLEREQLRMAGIYIAEPLALAGPDFLVAFRQRLRAVTGADVENALARYLADRPCRAVLIEPGTEPRADAAGRRMPPGMAAAMGVAPGSAMGSAMGATAATQPGEAGGLSDGDSAPPTAAARVPVTPVERTQLASGAVLVSQTDPASPLMAIHLAARGRAQIDRECGVPGSVDLVHRLLTTGTDHCDEICLARRLRALGAKVKLVDDERIPMDDYYTNGRFSFVRVEVGADNGPAALDLLIEMTQHGAFDAEAFGAARDAQIARLEQSRHGTRPRANALLDQALYGDHPLVQPPEGAPETLATLTYGQAQAVYREAFAPANLIFAVVSPLAHAELAAQLDRQLAGTGAPTTGIPPPPVTRQTQRLTESLGGELAAIRLGAIFDVAPDDVPACELLVAILSDQMAMDLRERRGLSYSVGAQLAVDDYAGEFVAWLNPPRERAAEGEDALTRFVADFDAQSVTQEELDRVRSARQGRAMMRRLSSISRAYYLAMAELQGDLSRYTDALAAYDQVTLKKLTEVAERYLEGLPLITVVVD